MPALAPACRDRRRARSRGSLRWDAARRFASRVPLWLGLSAFALAALPAASDEAGLVETPEAFCVALQNRRSSSPPLDVVLRVARGAGVGEETREVVLTYRWLPDAQRAPFGEAGVNGVDPFALPSAPGGGRTDRRPPASTLAGPLYGILRDLELPLLRPEAMRIRRFRRHAPPAAPFSRRPPRPAPPPFPSAGGQIVIGPAMRFHPPRLPDEYDLARVLLVVNLDRPEGPLEAVVDSSTFYVERLTLGAGADRTIAVVESVVPVADGAAHGGAAGAAEGTARAEGMHPHAWPGVSRPAAAARHRGSTGAPAARGVLRVAGISAFEPRRAILTLEGFAHGLADGAVVEIRLCVRGEEIERGRWEHDLGSRRCAAAAGRFGTSIEAPCADLVAGRVTIAAARGGERDALAECAMVVPAAVWRLQLIEETRVAARLLEKLGAARPLTPRHLAELARIEPWRCLPATRRAVESWLQARAAQGKRAEGDGPAGPPPVLLELLAREVRWAIAERLEVDDKPLPAQDARALRESLADLPPCDEEIDRELGALIESAASKLPAADKAGLIRAMKQALRPRAPEHRPLDGPRG